MAVVGTGVAAGAQLMVASHVAPRVAGFGSDLAYRMHDALLHHEGHNAVTAAPSATASVCAALTLILDGVGNEAGIATVVGLVAMVVVVTSTLFVFAPANDEIRQSLTQAERPDYDAIGRRWRRANLVRAACGSLSFMAFTIAALAAS